MSGKSPGSKRHIPALGERITKVRGRVVATEGIMRMRTFACVSVCNSFWCLYIYTCSPLIYFRYLYVCVFISLQRTFHYPLFLRFRPNVRRRSIDATQCCTAASIKLMGVYLPLNTVNVKYVFKSMYHSPGSYNNRPPNCWICVMSVLLWAKHLVYKYKAFCPGTTTEAKQPFPAFAVSQLGCEAYGAHEFRRSKKVGG